MSNFWRREKRKRRISAALSFEEEAAKPSLKMAEEAILGYLEKNVEISDSGRFADEFGLDHNEVVNVIKSLNGFRYVDAEV